jgi:hypothetical protein
LLARNDAALSVVNAVAYYLIPLKSHQFDYATLYFYIILLFKNYSKTIHEIASIIQNHYKLKDEIDVLKQL